MVKLPVGYKCRLFGSSKNSLYLREYNYDHGDGCSTEFLPPGIPTKDEMGDVAREPLAVHITMFSTDNDGSTPVLPICLEDKSSACVSSTTLKKKKKLESRRYSRYNANC
jgi:hypothetical protein